VLSGLNCPEFVQGAFWRVLKNGMATMFAQHEPSRAFMGHGGEVHSGQRSYTYKYQGAVCGYPDGIAQHLSRGLPFTCGIDAMSSCCTLPG
jgi:hypothetical protein